MYVKECKRDKNKRTKQIERKRQEEQVEQEEEEERGGMIQLAISSTIFFNP